MDGKCIGRQAIVVGAGIGGLAASRVLAEHFEHVTVLERDTLPTEPGHRIGTPQDRHAHGLLGGGQQALCDMFPAFERDLATAGAVSLRMGLDLRIERPGFDPFPQRDLGWSCFAMSRPLAEFALRRQLAQFDNITIRQGSRAREVLATDDGSAVTAIRIDNGRARSETLSADLVIDASGRGALALALLRALGRPTPEETSIGVDICYATAIFAIPEDASTGWKGVMTFPDAPRLRRCALMLPLEAGRWILSAGAAHGERPPADAEGFVAFLQSLRTPTIYNAVRQARRLGEIARFAFPASVWRHFERTDTCPRGLIAFGDAICRFNPVYGQGMSVAAKQAQLLGNLLAARLGQPDPLSGLGSAFYKQAADLFETPWSMAASFDLADPLTVGERPADFERSLRFGRALLTLAARDPDVHKLIIEVQHLMKPRRVYRDPQLQQRVLAVIAENP